MAQELGIGVQDFEEMIKKDYLYVDKTSFIREWWESGDAVTLITRPRRFGKTLTISMLDKFFSNTYEGKGELFSGLEIWKEEKYHELQGTYPVICMTFANIKEVNYQNARWCINRLIKGVYQQYAFLLEGDTLSEEEKKDFRMVTDSMLEVMAAAAIPKLSEYLCRYYKKKVIILLDEFDTPLMEAYTCGYGKELSVFMRNMFIAAFKANDHLERALITGVTGISRDSVMADLNHLKMITTTSEQYASSFGFTEEEAFAALEKMGMSDRKEEVKEWYGGFRFGGTGDPAQKEMYNPWSVINYMDTRDVKTYWANSGANSLIGKMLREGSREVKESLECLLRGEHLRLPIEEQIVYEQLRENEYALWSFLLAWGYLTVVKQGSYRTAGADRQASDAAAGGKNKGKDKKRSGGKKGKKSSEKAAAVEPVMERKEIPACEEAQPKYELAFPNREVSVMFRDMVQGWFLQNASDYNDFIKALLVNDPDNMNRYMNRLADKLYEFFDTEGLASGQPEPGRFYHAFVSGMMVGLADRYHIAGAKDCAPGSYDIMLEPKREGLNAYVIGFRMFNKKQDLTMEDTIGKALAQIDEKKYAAGLEKKGVPADKIKKYCFAFQGKEVLIG